jgi:hypothetical protein
MDTIRVDRKTHFTIAASDLVNDKVEKLFAETGL